MHEFYERIRTVFQEAGSNRHQFCRKRGHKYQTLQAYWNTDKLPSGEVLEDLAKEYNVSLDALVLGGSAQAPHEESPIVNRIIRYVRQLDDVSLLRIDGALQMFQHLLMSGSLPAEAPGPADAAERSRPAGTSRPDLEFLPPKMEHATELLGEISRLVHRSGMSEKEKSAARAMLHQAILDIYQREVRDEWAELEEVE
jgi:transcriptional regulator with XRE-family HTH domain